MVEQDERRSEIKLMRRNAKRRGDFLARGLAQALAVFLLGIGQLRNAQAGCYFSLCTSTPGCSSPHDLNCFMRVFARLQRSFARPCAVPTLCLQACPCPFNLSTPPSPTSSSLPCGSLPTSVVTSSSISGRRNTRACQGRT